VTAPALQPGLQPGDEVELRIERVGFGGAGLAVHAASGLRCRVPKALPGELVTAAVVKVGTRAVALRLLSVRESSPVRVEPPCRHFAACGGCTLQHVPYPQQLVRKHELLRERLTRTLGEEVASLLEPVEPAPAPLGGRSRNLFTVAGSSIGFIDPLAKTVVDVDRCLLATPASAPLLTAVRVWLRSGAGASAAGLLAVQIRTGIAEPMLVLVVDEQCADLAALQSLTAGTEPSALASLRALLGALPAASVWASPRRRQARGAFGHDFVHLQGPDHLLEQVGPVTLVLSPRSFTQVDAAVAALLYRRTAAALDPPAGTPVLDLFSGSGALAFHLGARGNPVLGVELSFPAVGDAQRSAARNCLHHVGFRNGRAEVIARRLFLHRQRFAHACVNPPRTGLPVDLPELLPKLGVERLCYVSCSPPTLVRDLAILGRLGYRPRQLVPFDMFPQTWHLEVLAVLER
jgi:23S rRNA (uracil1939-C5)-methyltransferase